MKVKLALLLTLIGTLPLAAQNVRQEQDTVSYMNDDPFNLEQIVVTAYSWYAFLIRNCFQFQ